MPVSAPSGPRLFFDVNLPLFLWKSRLAAWDAVQDVWQRASVVEVRHLVFGNF